MPRSDQQRGLALIEEVRVSIDLLKDGLGALQRIDAGNDAYYTPLLLLASGLERLMKTILCYQVIEKTGRLPNKGEFPEIHDLVGLLDRITESEWPQEYTSRPVSEEDLEYLRGDTGLRPILQALSDFADARRGRYYNLEVLLGRDPDWDSPEQAWSALEMAILREQPDWEERMLQASALDDIYEAIAETLVARLERMLRALARLFTLGALGEEAARVTGLIAPFLFRPDEDLGRQSY
jgi:hypothetical protein